MPYRALRGWTLFKAVHSSGRFRRGSFLTIHYLPNNLAVNRYGAAAKVKAGNAVVRNRLRRWTKELLRTWDSQLAQGYDIIVLTSRPEAAVNFSGFAEQLAYVLSLCRLTGGQLRAN